MGGIHLTFKGKVLGALTFKWMMLLIDEGIIDPPDISESVINDKSKGDFLTKSFVVLQTSWFGVQCVGRWFSRLPTTQIEIVTVAFATLNVFIYLLWWDKPYNVNVAISVPSKHDGYFRCNLSTQQYEFIIWDRHDEGPISHPPTDSEKLRWHWIRTQLQSEDHRCREFWLSRLPLTLLSGIVRPLRKLMFGVYTVRDYNCSRLPMFFAEAQTLTRAGDLAWLASGLVFGGIHLISWSSSFPTEIERTLWRVAALTSSCSPAIFIASSEFLRFWHKLGEQSRRCQSKRSRILWEIVWMIGFDIGYDFLIPLAYLVSRLLLLFLAFSSLRELPPTAFLCVKWASVVPHIS